MHNKLTQQLLDVLLLEDKANISLKNLTFICPHSGKEALQCPQHHLFILPVSGALCLFICMFFLIISTDKLQNYESANFPLLIRVLTTVPFIADGCVGKHSRQTESESPSNKKLCTSMSCESPTVSRR